MDKANIYIQKLIILILVFCAGAVLFPIIKIQYLLPALFFILAFLVSKITGSKPEFLFGLSKTDEFLNNKAGFWILFKWVLILFGLLYDIVVWTLFGVYILFTFLLDFILFIKTIIFWITYAIIWVFKQFVPPLVFIYKMFIYYVLRWNWWIYKLSFKNIAKSISLNFYIISFIGAVLMLLVILLFYGVGLLMGIPEIAVIGAVFSLLPLVWSYGEISSIRFRNSEDDSLPEVRSSLKSGFDAVKAVLNYFVIFLLLALVEVIFNLLGWIPQLGFSFMGLALNVNNLASLLLLFILVILLFAKLIIPPHVVYNTDFKSDINGSLNFLAVIGKRFLRYLMSSFSTAFFGIIVILIPCLIVFLSVIITINVKNTILDGRISVLNRRASVLEGLEKYKALKDKDRIVYYKSFPQNVLSGFAGMKSLNATISNLEQNIVKGEDEINALSREFSTGIDSIDKKIELFKTGLPADTSTFKEISQLDVIRHLRMESFSKWEQEGEYSIGKMKIDLADKKGLMIQLPVVFLLSIFWAAFFGGLVLTFLISYLGNVYYELYNFKEDENPIYFRQVITQINTEDRNQPLLGFTLLFFISFMVVYYAELIDLMNLYF
jgi:hypothetical protein